MALTPNLTETKEERYPFELQNAQCSPCSQAATAALTHTCCFLATVQLPALVMRSASEQRMRGFLPPQECSTLSPKKGPPESQLCTVYLARELQISVTRCYVTVSCLHLSVGFQSRSGPPKPFLPCLRMGDLGAGVLLSSSLLPCLVCKPSLAHSSSRYGMEIWLCSDLGKASLPIRAQQLACRGLLHSSKLLTLCSVNLPNWRHSTQNPVQKIKKGSIRRSVHHREGRPPRAGC